MVVVSSLSDVSQTLHTQTQDLSCITPDSQLETAQPQPETPSFIESFLHTDLAFCRKCYSRWSSLTKSHALLGSHQGHVLEEEFMFPHVGLCYFFHPPSQGSCRNLWQAATFSFLRSQESGSLYFVKRQMLALFNLITPENNRKESRPLLFMPKESAWAAFWMLPLAQGQKSPIENGLCSRGSHPPADALSIGSMLFLIPSWNSQPERDWNSWYQVTLLGKYTAVIHF